MNRRRWALLLLAASAAAGSESPAASGAEDVWSAPEANHLGGPSRDGKYLSHVDVRTGDLAVRVLATGEKRRLTRKHPKRQGGEFAYFSVISPDGRRVAYAWFNNEKFYDLRVVGMDGAGERVLFRNPEAGFVQPCSWSPDGEEILTLFFRKDNISQIAMVSAEDGSVRVLKSLSWFYPKKMDLSPDGRFIVYDHLEDPRAARRDIMLLAADGSHETKLVAHAADDTYPLWTPDGRAVIFLSDRSGTLDAWRVSVDEKGAASEAIPLVRGLGRVLPMGITNEGDYYFALRTGLTDIFTASVDWSSGRLRSKPVRLPTRFPGVNSAADWSRDGERIGFLSVRGSENYGEATRIISIRELKSGTERDLRTRMAQVEQLAWSPDGASLLISGVDRRGRSGLFLVDTANGRTSDVVVGSGEIHGVWAKDGRSVYYLSGNEIRRRPLAGEAGSASLMHRHDAPVSRPALSPDGERLAFACRHGEILLLRVNAGAVEDSGLVRTTAPERGHLTGLAWAPDGRRLLLSVRNDDRENVWIVAAGGSDATKLELPAGIRGPVRPYPDGQTIAFAAGSPRTEIWRLRTLASKHGTRQ